MKVILAAMGSSSKHSIPRLLEVVTSWPEWEQEAGLPSNLTWLSEGRPCHPLVRLPHPLPLVPGLWLPVTIQSVEQGSPVVHLHARTVHAGTGFTERREELAWSLCSLMQQVGRLCRFIDFCDMCSSTISGWGAPRFLLDITEFVDLGEG